MVEYGISHDFSWAVSRMKENKKVRRKEWPKGNYYYKDNRTLLNHVHLKPDELLFNIEATDWEIYEEEETEIEILDGYGKWEVRKEKTYAVKKEKMTSYNFNGAYTYYICTTQYGYKCIGRKNNDN